MSKTVVAMVGSLVLAAGAFWLLSREEGRPRTNGPSKSRRSEIVVYCAASNQSVMESILSDYERETGRKVVMQYGSSQTLLSQLQVAAVGDLYLPADDSFLEIAREKDLIDETLAIGRMRCGLAVPKGNPRKIKNLESLFNEDLRIVQANPEAAAVAKLTKTVLSKSNLWDRLDRATDAYRTTVIDVANDIKVGAADVGFVYDAVLHPFPELEFLPIEELASAVSNVSIGILKSTKRPTAALHFARYVTARDRGLLNYQEHGFQTFGGDVWQDVPELAVYAGSMLRPAIEETIIAFESREGVSVSRSYNGCGILVGQMKAGQHPDAYFACDVEFMSQVKDIFPESVDVSQNELVIIVPKGNPQKIRLLSDLTKPGLRVGIGHEKQCAMGWITQRTLKESGIQTEFMSNVTVQTPTGDMLVNQLRTGSLDAAVVYLSNAAGAADYLDAIQIVGLQCSIATQPWAVAKDSKHGRLADRLFQRICSAESQEVFQAEGFQWKLSKDPPVSPIEPSHSLSQ